jgi:hypothetical protein
MKSLLHPLSALVPDLTSGRSGLAASHSLGMRKVLLIIALPCAT